MESSAAASAPDEDIRRRRAPSTTSISVVPRGATYGFIGPSGAGKTTCIRMIMSILFPDSGELSVLGHRSALEAKDRIGYLPEERGVYRKMRVGDFLTYIAQLKGVSADGGGCRARRGCWRALGLVDVEKKSARSCRKGMLQRVAVRRRHHQPARAADSRRAVQRPRPGQRPAAEGADRGGAAARRDDPVLDAHHGARRRAVPARRDDPPGPEGARRADGRPAAPVRSRASSSVEPLDAAATCSACCVSCPASPR